MHREKAFEALQARIAEQERAVTEGAHKVEAQMREARAKAQEAEAMVSQRHTATELGPFLCVESLPGACTCRASLRPSHCPCVPAGKALSLPLCVPGGAPRGQTWSPSRLV